MKKIVYLGIALCLLFFFSIQAEASTVKQGAFEFTYDMEGVGKCCITKIKVINKNNAKVLAIPSTLDGLKVVKIGTSVSDEDVNAPYSKNVFHMSYDEDLNLWPENIVSDVAKIEQIVLPDSVKELTNCCFDSMSGLKKINLPSGMTKLGLNALTCCPKLKELHIPKGINKNVENLVSVKWTKFTIAKKNKTYKMKNGFLVSKNGKKLYGCMKKMKVSKIPEGVTKIKENAFIATYINHIHIPSTVKKIGKMAFDTEQTITVTISKKNKYYGKDGNCIYSKRTGRLVAVEVKKNTMTISSKVTKLSEGTSVIGKKVKKIIIPKTVNKMERNWLAAKDYNKKKVYIYRTNPPIMDGGCCNFGWKMYVPKSSYKKYKVALKKADKWGDVKLYKMK